MRKSGVRLLTSSLLVKQTNQTPQQNYSNRACFEDFQVCGRPHWTEVRCSAFSCKFTFSLPHEIVWTAILIRILQQLYISSRGSVSICISRSHGPVLSNASSFHCFSGPTLVIHSVFLIHFKSPHSNPNDSKEFYLEFLIARCQSLLLVFSRDWTQSAINHPGAETLWREKTKTKTEQIQVCCNWRSLGFINNPSVSVWSTTF